MIAGGSGGGTVAPFDPSVTVDATTTISSGGTDDWHGRASIKRRPSDNALVLAYRRGTAHASSDGDLYLRFSDDDGATWTAENTTLGGAAVGGFPMNPEDLPGEPWLYVCPNGDLLIHMWGIRVPGPSVGTYQSRSTDGGETWSTPERVNWIGLEDADDSRTYATDDDFVFDRTIYAGARQFVSGSASVKSILVKSDNNGESWELVSDISDFTNDTQEVGLEYVGNQTIVAMLRDYSAHVKSYQRVSTDMGETWGTLTDVTSTVGLAGRQRVYTRSHLQGLSGWWKDPMLFMVGFIHTSPGDSHPRRNAIWISPDRGTTWDGPHYVDTAAQDGGYGDLFWDHTNDRLVAVINKGAALSAASLIQYDLTIAGL